MKRKKAPWQILKDKGYKVFNDGMNNKMFKDYTTAKANGYMYEGFAMRDQTTRFSYSDLKNRRNK